MKEVERWQRHGSLCYDLAAAGHLRAKLRLCGSTFLLLSIDNVFAVCLDIQ